LKVSVTVPLPAGKVAGVIGTVSITIAGVVSVTVVVAETGVVPVAPIAVKVMAYWYVPLVGAGIVEPG
jgi:hypothetical protein